MNIVDYLLLACLFCSLIISANYKKWALTIFSGVTLVLLSLIYFKHDFLE